MGVDVPGRRDRKKQQTREALITAALRLVDKRGLDRVTVEDISEAADVSSRTFFNYFPTKDEALIGDPVTDAPDFGAGLLAQPAGLTVVEAIRRALTPAVADIQEHRELWRLRMRVIKDNPSLLPALFARGAAFEQEFITAIAERTGHPADSAFTQLTASLVGAAFRTAMIRWATAAENGPFAPLVDEAFTLLGSGLAEPARPTAPPAPQTSTPTTLATSPAGVRSPAEAAPPTQAAPPRATPAAVAAPPTEAAPPTDATPPTAAPPTAAAPPRAAPPTAAAPPTEAPTTNGRNTTDSGADNGSGTATCGGGATNRRSRATNGRDAPTAALTAEAAPPGVTPVAGAARQPAAPVTSAAARTAARAAALQAARPVGRTSTASTTDHMFEVEPTPRLRPQPHR